MEAKMCCDNILAMKEKSVNKFRTNMEAIIEKYSRPYDESKVDIIDLETLTICCDKGQIRDASYLPRRIGRTKLAVEDHFELDMTNCAVKCMFNVSHINCSVYEQSMSLAPEAQFPNESMQQNLPSSDVHSNHSVCHSMQGEPEPSDAETISDESDSDSWESEDEAGNKNTKRYGSFSEESSSDDFVVEEPSSGKLSSLVLKQENDDTVEQSKASSSPGFKNVAAIKSTSAEQSGFDLKNYIHLLQCNSSSKKDSGNVITAGASSVSKRDPSRQGLFNGVNKTATRSLLSLLNSVNQHRKDEQECVALNENRKPVSQKHDDTVLFSTGTGSSHSTGTKMGESAANHVSVQDTQAKGATKILASASHEELSEEESRVERRYREGCPNSTAFSPVASVISPACKRAGNLYSSRNVTLETIASPRSQVIQAKPSESKSLMEMYFKMKNNVSCSSPSTVSTKALSVNSNVGFPDRPTNKCSRVSSECVEDTITGSIDMLSLGSPGMPNSVSSNKLNTKNQEKAPHGRASVAVNDAEHYTSSQLTKVARQNIRKVKTEYLGTAKNTLPSSEGACRIKTGISSNSSLSPSDLLSNLNLGSPNDFGSKSERRLQKVNKSRNRKHSESAKTKGDVDFDKNANCVKPGFVRKLQFWPNNYGKNSIDRTRQKTTTACTDPSDNILNKRIENTVICSDESMVNKINETFTLTVPGAKSFHVPARFPLLDATDDESVEDDEDCFADLVNLTDDEIEAIGKGQSDIDDTNSDNGLVLVGATSTPTKDIPGGVFEASFISSISETSEIMRIKEIAMKAVDETICSVSSIDCTLMSTVEDKITFKDFGMPSSENLVRDDATSRLADNNKTLVSVPAKPYCMVSQESCLISASGKISSVPAKFMCSLRLEKLVTIPRHFSVDGKSAKSVELKSQSGILNSRRTRFSNFQKTRSNDVSFERRKRASKRHRSSSSSSSDVEKKTVASNVNSDFSGIKPIRQPHSKVHIVYNTRHSMSPGSYKNAIRVCGCCSNTK